VSDLATPQRPETMTPRQLDRRRRVLDAVHDLLAERPLRELQVKDIADRAQVSLAAIYRYFASKEHLLAEALADWAEDRGRAYDRRPPSGTVAERFATIVRRGIRAYRRSPQYAELFLETVASRDAHAVECMGRISELIGGGMRDALLDIDPAVAGDIRRTVGHAWIGGLFECVHGRSTFAELEQSLVATCILLLEPLEPTARG
jgi:TetR/AcrR family transcriptional regulator, cholesterol catabolism regulator